MSKDFTETKLEYVSKKAASVCLYQSVTGAAEFKRRLLHTSLYHISVSYSAPLKNYSLLITRKLSHPQNPVVIIQERRRTHMVDVVPETGDLHMDVRQMSFSCFVIGFLQIGG